MFDWATATWTATAYYIADFMHIMLTLSSASSANFTIKVQGSMSDKAPDFSASQSNTNRRDYVQVKNYQSWSNVDWDIWIGFAWTDTVEQYELNVNGLKWICATITTRAAGSISLRMNAYSNE